MDAFEELKQRVEENRRCYAAGEIPAPAERRRQLRRMLQWLCREQGRVLNALNADLHKCETEARLSEIFPLIGALKHLIRRLPRLTRNRRVPTPLFCFPASGYLRAEPYGQVLIFGTWNYPFLLAVEPVAAAIAAGNRVLLVLSPQAPATARVIGEMLRETLPPEAVTIVPREVSFDRLWQLRYDKIFFTGGIRAGREVLRRAAETLTPVTLELGGKSPAVVERGADLRIAARRLVWGKFLNAGQTCVAPDYLLVRRELKEPLLVEMQRVLKEFYGEDALNSPDYPRIVNRTHYERLNVLLTSGRLAAGGEKAPEELFIAPTILDDVKPDDPIMENEIFGPILPVLAYNRTEEAIAFINERPKPLALYCFGNRRSCRAILGATSSGSACVNDCVMQLCNPHMPFGGVGASGMGCYHGDYGFACFSHLKPVMVQRNFFDAPLRYPPFRGWKQRLVAFFCR